MWMSLFVLKHYMSMASPDPNYMYVNKSLAYALEMDGGSSVCMSYCKRHYTLFIHNKSAETMESIKYN